MQLKPKLKPCNDIIIPYAMDAFRAKFSHATCVLLIKLINLPYCRWQDTQHTHTHIYNISHSSFSNKEIKSLSAIKETSSKINSKRLLIRKLHSLLGYSTSNLLVIFYIHLCVCTYILYRVCRVSAESAKQFVCSTAVITRQKTKLSS